MTIEINNPGLQLLIQKRLDSGAFQDLDELLTKALEALPKEDEPDTPAKRRKRLIDVLMSAPFAGSELRIERQRDYPRRIDQ